MSVGHTDFYERLTALPHDDVLARAQGLVEIAQDIIEARAPGGILPDPVELAREAVGLLERTDDPEALAVANQTLGLALIEAGSGYRDTILREAISVFDTAIKAFEALGFFEDAVATVVYRASARTELHGADQFGACELAIQELEGVLRTLKRRADPELWANTHTALGSAYSHRVAGHPDQNLQRAAQAYRAALRVYRPGKETYGRAQAFVNLSHASLLQLYRGDPVAAVRAARYCRQALALMDGSEPLDVWLTAIQNLATSMVERDSRQAVANCLEASALLEQGIARARQHDNAAADVMALNRAGILLDLCHAHGVNCLDEAADANAALDGAFDPDLTTDWWLTWQRHRLLLAALRDDPVTMKAVGRTVLDQLTHLLRMTHDLDERAHRLSATSDIVNLATIGVLEEDGPELAVAFALEGYHRLFSQDEAAPELPEGCIEVFLLSPVIEDMGLSILRTRHGADLVLLPGLGKLAWSDWIDGVEPGLFAGLEAMSGGGGQAALRDGLDDWLPGLQDHLVPLADALIELAPDQIRLRALGPWASVPFAAAFSTREDDHAAGLPDPIQGPCHRGWLQDIGLVAMVIDDSLTTASDERQDLLEAYPTAGRLESLIDVQDRLRSGEPLDLLHFACHAHHDRAHIDSGGIDCGDGDILAARWIYQNARLTGSPLICLAACETGMTDFTRLPNEEFGLPQAFLKAGAGAVVSTLWPVDDMAARLFVQRLYGELRQGKDLAFSVGQARSWLRSLSASDAEANANGYNRGLRLIRRPPKDQRAAPFSHPVHWAGFTLHLA